MNNAIIATIFFSFKGERFSPSTRIDLDELMERGKGIEQEIELSPIYTAIAIAGGIDRYSYTYEVMLVSDIHFSEATGLASQYVNDGSFDFQGFQKNWLQQQNLLIVQKIAQKYMNVSDLEQQPQLRDALLEALQRGRN